MWVVVVIVVNPSLDGSLFLWSIFSLLPQDEVVGVVPGPTGQPSRPGPGPATGRGPPVRSAVREAVQVPLRQRQHEGVHQVHQDEGEGEE